MVMPVSVMMMPFMTVTLFMIVMRMTVQCFSFFSVYRDKNFIECRIIIQYFQ